MGHTGVIYIFERRGAWVKLPYLSPSRWAWTRKSVRVATALRTSRSLVASSAYDKMNTMNSLSKSGFSCTKFPLQKKTPISRRERQTSSFKDCINV